MMSSLKLTNYLFNCFALSCTLLCHWRHKVTITITNQTVLGSLLCNQVLYITVIHNTAIRSTMRLSCCRYRAVIPRYWHIRLGGRKLSVCMLSRPVPARHARHSQMCPQLDVFDITDQKPQDVSDKARYVRQKWKKNRKICPTCRAIDMSDENYLCFCLRFPSISRSYSLYGMHSSEIGR